MVYFFQFKHILRGGRQQTLLYHFFQPTQASIPMTMQLLGVSKAAFYRFLALGINLFPRCGESLGIDSFLGRFRNMAGRDLDTIGVARALRAARATRA